MVQGGFREAFAPLGKLFSTAGAKALEQFQVVIDATPDPEDLCRKLHATYARLFLGAGQGLSAPPYHSCYLQENAPLMGPPAIRMRERLSAAGLAISGRGNEPPDHLAVELEFLYFLMTKAPDDPGSEAPAVEFTETELCPWLPLFSDRLSQIPDAGPYDHAAVLARELAFLITGKE
jgi:TorA-specific chaperone